MKQRPLRSSLRTGCFSEQPPFLGIWARMESIYRMAVSMELTIVGFFYRIEPAYKMLLVQLIWHGIRRAVGRAKSALSRFSTIVSTHSLALSRLTHLLKLGN